MQLGVMVKRRNKRNDSVPTEVDIETLKTELHGEESLQGQWGLAKRQGNAIPEAIILYKIACQRACGRVGWGGGGLVLTLPASFLYNL